MMTPLRILILVLALFYFVHQLHWFIDRQSCLPQSSHGAGLSLRLTTTSSNSAHRNNEDLQFDDKDNGRRFINTASITGLDADHAAQARIDRQGKYHHDIGIYAAKFARAPHDPVWNLDSAEHHPERALGLHFGAKEGAHVVSTKTQTRFKAFEGDKAFIGYDPVRNQVVISFRGTVTVDNWASNLNFAMKTYPSIPRGFVHSGFLSAWRKLEEAGMKRSIIEANQLHPNTPILTTGHSRGGALAQLAALELIQNPEYADIKSKVNSVTFGSPRWCNGEIADVFDAKVDSNWRIVNEEDVISVAVPLASFLPTAHYQHTRPMIRYVTNLINTEEGRKVIAEQMKTPLESEGDTVFVQCNQHYETYKNNGEFCWISPAMMWPHRQWKGHQDHDGYPKVFQNSEGSVGTMDVLFHLRNGSYGRLIGNPLVDALGKPTSIDYTTGLAQIYRCGSSGVLSTKSLLQHILPFIPIESLFCCALVNKDWYLILKYMAPIPLIHLRTLSMGELLLWMPSPDQMPKTVLLKLKFNAGAPTFLQISTSRNRRPSAKLKNGIQEGYTPTASHSDVDFPSSSSSSLQIASSAGHYQMVDLSEIQFIIDGHWTPTFERFEDDGLQEFASFFHRSKCFSVVTNTYMTYDFICFNPETTLTVVNTLRSIIHQSRELSCKMAIHAKANKKYTDSMNQTPLVFHDTLSALNFEMFVLVLQDCIHQIGSELNIDIPSAIKTKANASLLYPMLLEKGIKFSEWKSWCRLRLIESLRSFGYIQPLHQPPPPQKSVSPNSTHSVNEDTTLNYSGPNSVSPPPRHGRRTPRKVSFENLKEEDPDDLPIKPHESIIKAIEDRHRRQSSLFGVKTFPMNESYDLFAGNMLSDDDMDARDVDHLKQPIYPEDAGNVNGSCLVM